MSALVVIHELINKFRYADLSQIAVSLIADEAHCENVRESVDYNSSILAQ